jgi:hypothetical protein
MAGDYDSDRYFTIDGDNHTSGAGAAPMSIGGLSKFRGFQFQ